MNIVVCGGRQQADYLLSVFANKRGNRIVVINDDEKNSIDCLKAIEYVPTQIFAEYFKLNVGLKGIKYDSGK